MARSKIENDSGCYVNGVYTTNNGTTHPGGLACPKGARLYDPTMTPAIFFEPDDVGDTEDFVMLTPSAAPDILPYYAISNYGRVMNIYTGKIMKPNYRPNGYEYLCLSADNCKNGQKKYNTHRLVMKTFDPREDQHQLDVNHIDNDKTHNYINKTMPDGTIQNNLEWMSHKENTIERSKTLCNESAIKLSYTDAVRIRELYMQGYTMAQIQRMEYSFVSHATIQNVCKNRVFTDPNYNPRDGKDFYRNTIGVHIISDFDAARIRDLHSHGYNNKQIKEQFYPAYSESTISDIVRGISHNRDT